MRRTAGIVGAGIGGLASAIALQTAGWEVTVFERDHGPGGAGTALGMWPTALNALDRIGLGDAVRKLGTPQLVGEFRRPDGARIGVMDVSRLRRRTGDPVYLLSRPALLRLLREATPERALRFDTPVTDLASLREQFDVVIAADGIFSCMRAQLLGGSYAARYTGITAWRGWIDGMATEAVTETWGAGAKFGVTPQEGGRTNWYATTVAAEGTFAPGSELAALKGLFGSWRGPVAQVLESITEANILRHDLYIVPRLPTFVRGNVALIGDAAHAMTPDLGRGACEALVDAVTLADCLQQSSTVDGALRDYDHARRKPVQRLASASGLAAWLTRATRLLWLREALLRLSLRLPPPP